MKFNLTGRCCSAYITHVPPLPEETDPQLHLRPPGGNEYKKEINMELAGFLIFIVVGAFVVSVVVMMRLER